MINPLSTLDPGGRPSARDVVEMLLQQVEKPVAGSRRSSRKEQVRRLLIYNLIL